jgi:hypothetical protein
MDQHGTLCHEDGSAKAYKPIGVDSIPLMESMIWPDDMAKVNVFRDGHIVKVDPKLGQRCDAESFAMDIEKRINRQLGFVACTASEGHDYYVALERACDYCGAAL